MPDARTDPYVDPFREEEADVARGFAALGHEKRLRIHLCLRAAGEAGLSAGEVASRTGIAPTSLSGHLGILARAGIVAAERRGRSIVYRTNPGRVAALAAHLVGG